MFEHMLDHENIEVVLDTDCRGVLKFTGNEILFEGKPFAGDVIYTGALDELFDCKFGRLPYRSLDFHFEHYDEESYQGHSVVNYTVSEDYTRITEFKFLTGQKNTDGTTIVKMCIRDRNTVWYDVLDQITDYATKDAALDTFASMVAAVHAGKIDGFTCDMPSAKSILVSNPDLKIIDFEGGTGSVSYTHLILVDAQCAHCLTD